MTNAKCPVCQQVTEHHLIDAAIVRLLCCKECGNKLTVLVERPGFKVLV